MIPEGVIPGVLFMILPGRKPVSAIPGMMLFVRTWLCKILIVDVLRREGGDTQIHFVFLQQQNTPWLLFNH